MNEWEYTGVHTHPIDPTSVEMVAYQRKDLNWDVFVYEPQGSCSELEEGWVDANHIFIQRIQDISEFSRVVDNIEERLGGTYHRTEFYREVGTRRIIQSIVNYLQIQGASGMWVRAEAENCWVLSIRKKDILTASEVVASNL